MKYVALLSGGKDSCYNLLHCAKNGHELVAAASLGPEPGKEELDSYMYQTVGQDAIEYVAQCLDVPLYRRVISGTSLEQGSEYGSRAASSSSGVKGDETEDLYELLLDVKRHHPDVQGVSAGAILSNYQRVRVEHVCRRLGLTALCYLWQREQAELLSEMVDAGLEAILIKVAGIGLTTKHLGKTLADMQPTLVKLNTLYGSHICGEGGEYETLTLDCPLFKKRINLENVETVIHSDNDFATVAYLRIKSATLEPKPESSAHFEVAIPPLLDEDATDVREAVEKSQSVDVPRPDGDSLSIESPGTLPKDISVREAEDWVAIGNIQHPSPDASLSLEDEMTACFELLKAEQLDQHSLSLPDCTSINLLISSMDYFIAINSVYARYFGTSPPARATVAVDLPAPHRVRIDCIARRSASPDQRQALHVQGLSYWAPANIGPYSQAILTDERVFVSGQIGLIPASLAFPSPASLSTETALAFQHAERIVEAVQSNNGGGWTGQVQSAVYWLAEGADARHVNAAREVYDAKHGQIPSLFAAVKALPKGALVEKQIVVHTGRCAIRDEEDDEITIESRKATFKSGKSGNTGSKLYWESSSFAENTSRCAIVWANCGETVITSTSFNS
ncbi:hypothetical protein K523DRAFT_381775 [Schizophyllum commune Tattone D]|nr:hypothetical protein K523DRAFT_381775 [Schizophyllum commune Tattone D]